MYERLHVREKSSEEIAGEKELLEFLVSEDFSADEMRSAYYALCDISDETLESRRLDELTERMNNACKRGVPLTFLKQLIDEKQKWEDVFMNFNTYSQSLPLSIKEQRLLQTIVSDKRLGELRLSRNGEDAHVIIVEEGDTPENIANTITSTFTEMMEGDANGSYSIQFESNE